MFLALATVHWTPTRMPLRALAGATLHATEGLHCLQGQVAALSFTWRAGWRPPVGCPE